MHIHEISLDAVVNPVKSVTILQSSTAEVRRTFAVDLKAGRNILRIVNISSDVDAESPRIHGLGDKARVLEVSCDKRLVRASNVRVRPTKNAEALKKVLGRRRVLECTSAARERELEVLNTIVTTHADLESDNLKTLLNDFVERDELTRTMNRIFQEQIAELDEEIWRLNNLHKGSTGAVVVATVLAKNNCSVNLGLTYLVARVRWTPYYDLHASTAQGKTSPEISLHYCANVVQSTGEDWNDALVTFSTAKPHILGSLSVPLVDRLKVTATHPRPVRPASPLITHPLLQPPGMSIPHDDNYDMDYELMAGKDTSSTDDIGPIRTVVDQSALSLMYHVDEPVSLPSDGVVHKIPIVILPFTAEIKYVCVPHKTAAVYIQGTIKNTSEYDLLAGPVSVFVDDGFVTKTSLKLISVNECFDCVLGVDTALKVTRDTTSSTDQEPARSFAEPSTTTTRSVVTTVSNGHPFEIVGLVVCDSLPLGDKDANCVVTLRKPEGLAKVEEGEDVVVQGVERQGCAVKVRWSKVEDGKGGEKDGMYEWVCGMPAGENVKLVAEWDVKAPSQIQWTEIVNED